MINLLALGFLAAVVVVVVVVGWVGWWGEGKQLARMEAVQEDE